MKFSDVVRDFHPLRVPGKGMLVYQGDMFSPVPEDPCPEYNLYAFTVDNRFFKYLVYPYLDLPPPFINQLIFVGEVHRISTCDSAPPDSPHNPGAVTITLRLPFDVSDDTKLGFENQVRCVHGVHRADIRRVAGRRYHSEGVTPILPREREGSCLRGLVFTVDKHDLPTLEFVQALRPGAHVLIKALLRQHLNPGDRFRNYILKIASIRGIENLT